VAYWAVGSSHPAEVALNRLEVAVDPCCHPAADSPGVGYPAVGSSHPAEGSSHPAGAALNHPEVVVDPCCHLEADHPGVGYPAVGSSHPAEAASNRPEEAVDPCCHPEADYPGAAYCRLLTVRPAAGRVGLVVVAVPGVELGQRKRCFAVRPGSPLPQTPTRLPQRRHLSEWVSRGDSLRLLLVSLMGNSILEWSQRNARDIAVRQRI